MKRLALAVLLLVHALPIAAQIETTVTITVRAHDAKLVASSVGGSRVVLRDASTHELLADGLTSGDTGPTDALLRTPIERRSTLATETSARFTTRLLLAKPRYIRAEVYNPIQLEAATPQATASFWVIPGKDMLGDGIMITLHGLLLEALYPVRHQFVSLKTHEKNTVTVRASAMLLCGCPITEQGLWKAENYEIEVTLYKDQVFVLRKKMTYAGVQSTFEAELPLSGKGTYLWIVTGVDATVNNTGVTQSSFVVTD